MTTAITSQRDKTYIDLLDSRYFLRLTGAPHELESIIAAASAEIIVIDEIQRIPELLNEIHRLIESRDPVSTLAENFLTLPWHKFLDDLWKDKFI